MRKAGGAAEAEAPMAMDDLDFQIMSLLEEDGRMAYAQMAQRLGVSQGTARNRTERLIRNGVMGVMAVSNPNKTGRGVSAVLGLDVETKSLESAAAAVAQFEEVRWLAIVSGMFDIVALPVLQSGTELLNLAAKIHSDIDGVKDVHIMLAAKLIKRGGRVLK